MHGKRYKDNFSKVDRFKNYDLNEAVSLLKEQTFSKFDETVDIAVNLGVDPKHADQIVRGTVSLPHGTGKETKVLVFAKGEKAMEAEEAGADFVGSEDYVQKIQGGWTDIDVVIATPDMMGQVGKLGRVLGPRGLMPNPKLGSVTNDLKKAVTDAKSGQIEIKNDKDEEIESIFSELLTDLGFVISEKPLLKIVGKIRFEKTDLKRDIEFIRYEFQLQILNNQDKIIIAISQSGREGHISEKEAKARIIRALKNKIKMDFSQKITQYFGNLISKK